MVEEVKEQIPVRKESFEEIGSSHMQSDLTVSTMPIERPKAFANIIINKTISKQTQGYLTSYYEIKLNFPQLKQLYDKFEYTVLRRYSDFDTLLVHIRSKFKGFKIGQMPDKNRLSNKQDTVLVNDRRRKFQALLQQIAFYQEILSDETVYFFLTSESQFQDYMKSQTYLDYGISAVLKVRQISSKVIQYTKPDKIKARLSVAFQQEPPRLAVLFCDLNKKEGEIIQQINNLNSFKQLIIAQETLDEQKRKLTSDVLTTFNGFESLDNINNLSNQPIVESQEIKFGFDSTILEVSLDSETTLLTPSKNKSLEASKEEFLQLLEFQISEFEGLANSISDRQEQMSKLMQNLSEVNLKSYNKELTSREIKLQIDTLQKENITLEESIVEINSKLEYEIRLHTQDLSSYTNSLLKSYSNILFQ